MRQSFADRAEHLFHNVGPKPSQPHLPKDDAKAVDVVALIAAGVALLFRGRISLCASGLLEDGEAVGVGVAEVDDFHLTAVAGEHDIGRFQVAVDDLKRMDIHHGVDYLPCHHAAVAQVSLPWKVLNVLSLQPILQRDAVDPFHDDTLAVGRDIAVAAGLHDIWAVEH